MNDKLEQLYNLYKQNGIIQSTDFNTFSTADDNQRKKLYELGKQKGLFKTTDYNTFNSAFVPVKKKEKSESDSQSGTGTSSSVMPSKPTPSLSGSSAPKYKTVSTSKLQDGSTQEVIKGDAGKGEKTYALRKLPNGREAWYEYSSTNVGNGKQEELFDKPITDPSRVSTLNSKFGKKASVKADEDIYTGFPEKEENEYRVAKLQNGNEVWEVRRKGQQDFTTIANKGSINALNNQFGKKVSVSTDAELKRDAQISRQKSSSTDFKEVNKDLIGKEEDEVISKLTSLYRSKGFSFRPYGLVTDWVIVKAKNGKEEKFSLDNFSESSDSSEAIKLRTFLSENQSLGDYIDEEREQAGEAKKDLIDLTQFDFNRQMSRLQGAGSQSEFENAKEINATETATKTLMDKSQEAKDLRKAIVRSEFDTQQRISDLSGLTTNKLGKEELAAIAEANKDSYVERYRINDSYINDIAQSRKDVELEANKLRSEVEEFNAYASSNNLDPESPEAIEKKSALEAKYNSLIEKSKNIDSEVEGINLIKSQNEKNAALYFAYNETRGSVAGGLWNGALKGFFGLLGNDNADAMVRTFGSEFTTKEFTQSENRSDLTKAAFSVSESLGALAAALVTGGTSAEGTLAKKVGEQLPFFAMSYNEIKGEMDSKEFSDVPDWQKEGLAIMYGLGIGYLDKISTNFSVKGKIPDSIAKGLIFRSIAGLEKGATAEAISAAIESNLKKDLASGVLKIVGNSLVEGTTEGVQSLAGSGLKAAFNSMTGQYEDENGNKVDRFNLNDWGKQALEEAYLGALGGAIMGVPSSLVKGAKNGFKRLDPVQMELNRKVIEDSNMRSMILTDIKTKLMSGEITKAEADEQLQSIKDASSLFRSVPADLSEEGKAQAFDLMIERSKIEKDIEGKEDNLVVGQKERIKEINLSLQELSTTKVEPVEATDQVDGVVEGNRAVVSGVEIIYPTEEEKAERTAARSSAEFVENTSSELPVEDIEVLSRELDGEFGLLTAENPLAQPLTDQENKALNQKAIQWLERKGYKPRRTTGKYGQGENSMFVPNLSKTDAIEFAKEFNQEAVAHSDGLVYQDGSMNPRSKSDDDFSFSEYSPESDMVSVVKTPEGLKTFSVGYDFASKVPAIDSQSQVVEQNELTLDNYSDVEKSIVTNDKDGRATNIAKAARAVLKSLPSAKIYLHNTTEEYRDAIAKAEGLDRGQVDFDESGDQQSNGTYLNGGIHIDMSRADASTVFHEAFHHAVVATEMKTELMRDWVDGLKKIVSDKDLIARLEGFESRYDGDMDSAKAEEFLAELNAILAEAKTELTTTKLQQFKQLVNSIAKKLGLPAVFKDSDTAQEVLNFMNDMAINMRQGKEILATGITTNLVSKDRKKSKKVKVEDNYKLSFVKQEDIIDINALIDDIVAKDQKVWFWVADQLGRGYYFDAVTGKEHYLDAGPSFALDPENRSKNIIWASGMQEKTLKRNASEADYIFIISGSPTASKLFNKNVFELFSDRVGDFDEFKKGVLESSKLKDVSRFFDTFSSWEEIISGSFKPSGKGAKAVPARKWLLIQANEIKNKNTPLKQFMDASNAFLDTDSLRDDFYRDNDFNINDIMLVLKPTGLGDKSKHSTYERDIIGEVVGVPDAIVNAEDVMPDEIYDKIVKTNNTSVKTSSIAPMGSSAPRAIVSNRKKQKLSKDIADKLTEDGNGNYVFHHYSGKKRESIKPTSGAGSLIVNRNEASALSSVGGVAQYYTMEGQVESGVGNVQHTILVPTDKVYDLQSDVDGFYDEAKKRFQETRPDQAFSPNYQAAWVSKVANENGYDMIVSKWRGDELRAQTTLELTPESENIQFKEKSKNEYNVGDEVIIYGSPVKITAIDGSVITFEGSGTSGTVDMNRNARSIRKKQKSGKKPLQKAIDKSFAKSTKKVVVNERVALRDQIKSEVKAARTAGLDKVRKFRAIAGAVNAMKRNGSITSKQAIIIVNKLAKVNLDSPVATQKFIDYASKVFDNADYKQQLSDAFKIQRQIKNKLKNGQASTIAAAKAFASIDPLLVDDFSEYMEYANRVYSAVRSSRTTNSAVELKSAMDIQAISEYTDAMIEVQNEKRKEEILAVYQELVDAGVISEEMSLKDIQSVINSLKDPSNKDIQEESIRAFINGRIELLNNDIQFILKNNIDPSGDNLEITPRQRELISKLIKIDASKLSIKEAIRLVEFMDNFTTNGVVDGIEEVSSIYEGKEGAARIKKEGIKARSLKTLNGKLSGAKTKAYGGAVWAQQMMTFVTLNDMMFKGVRRAGKVLTEMGFYAFSNGANKANNVWNKIVNEYSDTFTKLKPNGEKFNTAKNIYERGMYAFLNRTVAGTEAQQKEELARKVGLLKESISRLKKKGDLKQQKMADIYQELFDKLGLDENNLTISDIESRIDPINKDAVNWWVDEWGKHYSDLADVSSSVYNTILGKDINYTPDAFSKITSTADNIEQILEDNGGAFAASLNYVYDKKAGALMESKKLSGMDIDRFVDLDFDAVNSRAVKSALIDINTAAATRQIQGFLSSDEWSEIIPSKEDRDLYEAKLKSYIFRSRNKMAGSADKDSTLATIERITRTMGLLGTTKALGGVLQSIKQTVPVMINTAINTGETMRILTPFRDKDVHDWINRSGMAISNRGAESRTNIEAAHDVLEKAFEGSAVGRATEATWKTIEKANTMWLKVFLANPDVWVARSAFISYYKQDLKRQGIDTKGIDWTNHEMNTEAANYAQHMVDRQQNVSDTNLGGELFTNENFYAKMLKNILFPFASFAINQKSRMYSDVATIGFSDASLEDKVTAWRSLGGVITEMFTYQSLGLYIRYAILMAVREALTGYEPDEEEQEKWFDNQGKYMSRQMIVDLASPAPIADYWVIEAVNKMIEAVSDPSDSTIQDAVNVENEARILKGEDPLEGYKKDEWIANWKKEQIKDKQFLNDSDMSFGTLGIIGDKAGKLLDMIEVANTGVLNYEYAGQKQEKFIMEKDREAVKTMIPYMALYVAGFAPKEVEDASRYVMADTKKMGVSMKKGAIYQEIVDYNKGKEVDKIQAFLIDKMRGTDDMKASERIIEEIDWINEKGGLANDKQMDKYIEIYERDGSVGATDMEKIQKLK
jgi:hypothetical protein